MADEALTLVRIESHLRCVLPLAVTVMKAGESSMASKNSASSFSSLASPSWECSTPLAKHSTRDGLTEVNLYIHTYKSCHLCMRRGSPSRLSLNCCAVWLTVRWFAPDGDAVLSHTERPSATSGCKILLHPESHEKPEVWVQHTWLRCIPFIKTTATSQHLIYSSCTVRRLGLCVLTLIIALEVMRKRVARSLTAFTLSVLSAHPRSSSSSLRERWRAAPCFPISSLQVLRSSSLPARVLSTPWVSARSSWGTGPSSPESSSNKHKTGSRKRWSNVLSGQWWHLLQK